MRGVKVDLEESTVHIGNKKYWFKMEMDYNYEEAFRVWFTESKRFAKVDEEPPGLKKQMLDLIEKMEPTQSTAGSREVTSDQRLKLLNGLVDRAFAIVRKRKAKRAKGKPKRHQHNPTR
jgi:hypothetical protein